jgi:hypothetical protein
MEAWAGIEPAYTDSRSTTEGSGSFRLDVIVKLNQLNTAMRRVLNVLGDARAVLVPFAPELHRPRAGACSFGQMAGKLAIGLNNC